MRYSTIASVLGNRGPSAICFLALLGMLQGCATPMKCTEAVVTVNVTPDGKRLNVEVVKKITDPQELQTLVSMFPHMGEGRRSWIAGFWKAAASVKFTGLDGRMVQVSVDWDYTCWAEHDGDWSLDPRFGNYIRSLLAAP